MRDVIPAKVYRVIEKHLLEGSRAGEAGWEAGKDEEDTLTGDLGASLRRSWQDIDDDSGQTWKWQVTYKKFRGRGHCADEKVLGADGIFEIAVDDRQKGAKVVKGLLFQAKKRGDTRKKKLMEQASRMESVTPNSCAVFEYGASSYSAFDATEVGDIHAEPRVQSSKMRLGEYLATRFLPCVIGKRGIYYDAIRKCLVVPDETEGVKLVRMTIGDRIKVEVQSITK